MATWTYWVNSSGTTTATTSDETWDSWTYSSTDSWTSSTTTTNSTWDYWVYETHSTANEEKQSPSISLKVDRVSERMRANQAEINETWARILKEEAELTAQALLEDLLDDNQLEVYRRTGRVLVKGRKHDYIIRKREMTLKVLSKNEVVDLCCHLDYKHKSEMPETDNTIAKLLAIKYDEDRFNKMANQHARHRLAKLPEAARAA